MNASLGHRIAAVNSVYTNYRITGVIVAICHQPT
jgi:hypothetical protein